MVFCSYSALNEQIIYKSLFFSKCRFSQERKQTNAVLPYETRRDSISEIQVKILGGALCLPISWPTSACVFPSSLHFSLRSSPASHLKCAEFEHLQSSSALPISNAQFSKATLVSLLYSLQPCQIILSSSGHLTTCHRHLIKKKEKIKIYAFSISNKFPSELPSATAPSGKRTHSSYRSHFVSLDSCSLESGLKGTFRATLPRLLELLCLFKSRSTDRLFLANQNNYRRRLGKRDSTSSEQRLAILFSSEIASTFPSFLLQVAKS